MAEALGVVITYFTGHKYAEEYCQDLTRQRIKWTLSVEFDITHEDDGELYVYDNYIVTEYG